MMKYRSTRSGETVTAGEALLLGLARDGGLYVPEKLPEPFLAYDELKEASYQETARFVLARFFPDIPEGELAAMIRSAYTGTFTTPDIVPVKTMNESFSMAELFHGRTCAFKDLALSLFPYLLVWAKKHEGEKHRVLILTATSGDTGKAALEGFRDVPGANILVFYPSHGVSPLQKDQMQKQAGANVKVVGIEGNFDDAQSTLKTIFRDPAMNAFAADHGVQFSSANSINIGRLFPQVVYYVWIWLQLVRSGSIGQKETFNVAVPTGNFGNILAAWIAKRIGAPIDKLICASNKNNVLADFFETGAYDKNRPFFATESPSMDILISSNFERFLYYMTKGDVKTVADDMKALSETGRYAMDKEHFQALSEEMLGGWADDEAMRRAVSDVYSRYDYLMDPHTATAYAVYMNLRRKGRVPRHSHTVIAATAHPYKFPYAIAEALDLPESESPYDTLRTIAGKTGIPVPEKLASLEDKEPRFTETVPKDEMKEAVKAYIEAIGK